MKSYHTDLIRVTEAGAITASEWVGRGNKELADKAATDAMRDRLNSIDFRAKIAIGEGEKDESYGLFCGEEVGTSRDPNDYCFDIAIDPIEGTTPTVKGGYEAISVIAMGEQNCLYQSDYFYMDKLAYGPKVKKWIDQRNVKGLISLNSGVRQNILALATAMEKSDQHITVCVIDRPRTVPLVEKLRKLGCRIKFISDCDVTACIATCVPDSGIDLYWSIGGSPEAVLAAAAMKCMGGYLECREVEKKSETEFEPVGDLLKISDLAKGNVMFAATGITDGKLLKGVRWTDRGPETNSVAMRSESGTVRWLNTEHGN